VVAPTTTWEAARDTVTLATGGIVTVSVAEPLAPSLVAVMRAAPAPTAVTTPPNETVATAELSDDQPMVRPVRPLPPASFRVATAVVVPPTTIVGWPRTTETLATAGGPATPPPPPQPNAAKHNTIAVWARNDIETLQVCPDSKGRD